MRKLKLMPPLLSFWSIAALILLLRAASGQTALLAYFIVAIYGARSPRHAIEALVFSWLITLANTEIFGPVTGGSLGRYIALLGVFTGALFRFRFRASPLLLASVLFSFYMVLHSIFFSSFLTISVLKSISWMMAIVSITLSLSIISSGQYEMLQKNIYLFLAWIMFLCVPAYILLPSGQLQGYGYLRGLLGHSQATGALGAIMSIWAFGRLINELPPKGIDFAIFVTGVLVAFLSGTRTAAIALFIAIVVILFVSTAQNRRPLRQLLQGLTKPIVALTTTAVCVVGLMNIESITTRAGEFLSKNTSSVNLVDAYETSRGELIDRMVENIRATPMTGIGFGIASDPNEMEIEEINGMPVSAAVEKGVAHIAIWEELGLLGLLIYIYWITIVVFGGIKGDAWQLGILVVIFLLNFGDAYIFSAGGMGLLLLVLIGFASYRYKRDPGQRARQLSALAALGQSSTKPVRR